ncbi:MAG: metallo-mystery pair system four-Cys motif protein [Leptospiraceae bacterium]|nr:metallo-mystery pair system four-Cys motif protein [Leptospiraceae bacterium]
MKHFIILTILFLSTLINSCDTITGKKDTDKNPTQQAAIALVSNQINSSSPTSVSTINFNVVSGNTNVSCAGTLSGTIAGTTGATLNDLRFYVHDVKLISTDGTKSDFLITTDGKWQLGAGSNSFGSYSGVALLDFEDATNGCSGGTTETNKSIIGTSAVGNYVGVEFKIGVPFYLNHLSTSTATSPLNNIAMYWAWNSGYKFAKIEFTATSKNQFHLGSGSCSGNTTGPINECGLPNRPTISLTKATGFNATRDVITLDLNALFSGSDASSTGINICMTGNATTACQPIISNIGIVPSTGATTTQSAFSIR